MTLKYRAEELEALAVKWHRLPESEREHFKSEMSRAQWRRFERTLAKAHDGKRNYANKHTTREDVIHLLAMYIDRNLIPMAKRLDHLESEVAYMRLPLWRKVRLKCVELFAGLVVWLDKRGITLMELEHEQAEGDADTEPFGGASAAVGHDAGQSGPGSAEDRLHGRGAEAGRGQAAEAGAEAGAGRFAARAEDRAQGRAGEEASGQEEASGEEEARSQEEGRSQIEVVSR